MAAERNYAIDFIKFFAILIVVSVHTGFLKGFYITDLFDLHFVINTFSRFSVPFFFVISGFLIAQKSRKYAQTSQYFRKYLWKTLKLFLSWGLFYFCYDLIIRILYSVLKDESDKLTNYLDTFVSLKTLYYGPPATAHQLWYLTALIWSVVILFIFAKFGKLNLLLVISFVLNLIGIFGQSYSVLLTVPIETRDALFYGLFYTTLGYYMATHYDWIKSKLMHVNPLVYLALFVVFSLTQLAERAILIQLFGQGLGENYYFSTIPLIICLILFVLSSQNLGKNSFITKIGSTTVGIYVLHTFYISLVVNSLDLFGFSYLLQNIFFQLIYTPSVFILSYISYRGLKLTKHKLKSYQKETVSPSL
ncbi:acyltransferase [Paenibacillus albiflavus]|uniref:Acyltransferase n=1 Tax=Paenibacillus albiflavus TaxID=2545760 RepID=A0A4R4EH90_9BACL|nr:acyltransferase [Paenibacillus albiflavus]TCZ77525.1 acyltransferase [Paenibacillus albiflavus]